MDALANFQLILFGLALIVLAFVRYWRIRDENPNASALECVLRMFKRTQAPAPVRAGSALALAPKTQVQENARTQAEEPRMTWFEMLARCVDIFGNQIVHVLVVGPQGAGKTYFTNALLYARKLLSKHELLIIDPHLERTHEKPNGDWADGVQVVGAGRDWEAVDEWLEMLTEELDYRYKVRADIDKIADWRPATIVIDEWPAIMKNCPSAQAFIRVFGRESRKIGLHVIMPTQDEQIKTIMGEYGEGQVKKNFDKVLLRESAKQALPKHQWQRGERQVVYVHNETNFATSANFLANFMQAALSNARLARAMHEEQHIISEEVRERVQARRTQAREEAERGDQLRIEQNTSEIVRAAYILAQEGSDISDRRLAALMWPDKKTSNGGKYSNKAKKLKERVTQALQSVTVTDDNEPSEQ